MDNVRDLIDTTDPDSLDRGYVFSKKRLRILVLCRYSANQGSVVIDSINSFKNDSCHEVFIYSNHLAPFAADFPFESFDVVIIHYSIIPTLSGFIDNKTVARIAAMQCCKVLMAQDEYRCTTELINFSNHIGLNYFFTVVPKKAALILYEKLLPTCKLVHYLTGYVPEALTWVSVPKFASRQWDITYRGRIYPDWFGRIITLKINTALGISNHSDFSSLKLNISVKENDRVYGIDYINLLSQSKTTYATESSIEILDDLGRMMYFNNCFIQLSSDDKTANNIQILENAKLRYLKQFPGDLSVIAPRIFEAIAMRSVLVMPHGYYSGLLKPWEHYIPIMADLSNASEVVKTIQNHDLLSEIASRAFAEIAMNKSYQYAGFIKRVDQILDNFHVDKPINHANDSSFFSDLFIKYPITVISNPHALSFKPSQLRRIINKYRHITIVQYFILVLKKFLWRKS